MALDRVVERRPGKGLTMPYRIRVLVTALVLVLMLGGCADSSGGGQSSTGGSSSSSPSRPSYGERAVGRMTLPQEAGQVIVASWRGTGSPAAMVRRLHLGGVIALEDNISSPGQSRAVNSSVQRVVRRRGWPAFLAVDQEGGLVNRAGSSAVTFPAFMSAGAADDPALTRRAAQANAADMRRLGFDVVLAPVADVSSGDTDAVIGSRAAGGRPQLVARQVVAAGEGIRSAHVLPVVKHFPGHGSLPVDSHAALPVLTRSLRELDRIDLVPFRAAIRAGLPAVMTGHIAVRAVDRGVPASISHQVTTGLLRHRLGFHGLVVTDALNMGGVQGVAPGGRAAVRALHAGADVLLMPPDPQAARDRIVRAVRSGALDRGRLDEAAARMIDTLRGLRGRPRRQVDAARTARELSRAALTSVEGPCSGRLVASRVRVVGPPGDVATLDRMLADRGVTIAHDRVRRVQVGKRRVVVGHRKKWVRERYRRHGHWQTRRVRKQVPVVKQVPVYKHVTVPADAPTVALAGPGSEVSGPVDVLVALDRPGVLGRVGARVKLATYGDTATTLSVLVDALMGDRRAPGRLPIDVPGVARQGCP